ncbi:hypothetical protein HWV62_5820 [Athelia sp. TMB]|nr:hypothetical protein HWV62_5820 [Athelia sp. TMB]
MSASQAFQMFRTSRTSAAASSSSSPFAVAAARRRVALGARRMYSTEEAKETPATPDPDVEVSVEAETLAKLEVKAQEVVDLTVRAPVPARTSRSRTDARPQSRLRYLQADFLNLQRNAAREKEQQRDFAITRFATDLLETVDVLALALKSVPPEALKQADAPAPPADGTAPPKSALAHLQTLHEGVELTHRVLLQTLFKYHVKPFDPTGDVFDPNRHEALYQAPVPGKEPGTVIDCQKIGYTIKDRVLRAAQVGVAQ